MKAIGALALVVGGLLAVGPATAQDPPDAAVATDPAGDVAASGPAPEAFGFVDLVASSAALTGGALELGWTVAELSGHPQSLAAGSEYWLEFTYSGATFHGSVEVLGDEAEGAGLPGGAFGLAEGRLYRQDDTWTAIADGEALYLPDEDSVRLVLPLASIRTAGGLTPGPGEPLAIVAATAYWDDHNRDAHEEPPAGRVAYEDVAEFPGSVLRLPGSALEGIALSTTHQVRHSNGEATTFQWPLQLTNLRERPVTLELTADADPAMVPRLPAFVRLDPGVPTVVHAYATVPFAHQHGGQRVLTLRLSDGAGSMAFPLTVSYLTPPQPAGHHDTVYLHGSRGGAGRIQGAWLNTLAEDPAADGLAVPADVGTCSVGGTETAGDGWLVPLLPELTLGIDADVDRPAVLRGSLAVGAALPAGALHGEILAYDEDDWDGARLAPLVAGAATGRTAVEQQAGPGQVPFEMELPMPPAFDLMAPAEDTNLALRLVYCPDLPLPADVAATAALQFGDRAGAGLGLAQGGELRLPLQEYRDPIDLEAIASAVALRVEENRLRVAPGREVLWTVEAAPAEPASWVAELIGSDAGHAAILGGPTFRGGEPFTFHVAGTVPEDRRAGDLFEVIVSVEADGDAARAHAVRLTAIVDPDSQVDYGAQADRLRADADRPAPAGLPAVAALAATLLAIAGRRGPAR